MGIANERTQQPAHLDSHECIEDTPNLQHPPMSQIALQKNAVVAAQQGLPSYRSHTEHQRIVENGRLMPRR